MNIKRVPKGFLIRLDQGDELFSSLQLFADQHHIQSGYVSGTGMVRELELGFFNSDMSEYERTSFTEQFETLSLAGTIAEYQGSPIFRIHGVFGKRDLSTVGGLVTRAVTDMTMELFVSDFETRIERALEENSGLKLLNFDRHVES